MQGAGCRVQGAGCRVQGAGCRVQGAGFRVQGAGFRVQGSGCRVQGAGFVVARLPHRHKHDRIAPHLPLRGQTQPLNPEPQPQTFNP